MKVISGIKLQEPEWAGQLTDEQLRVLGIVDQIVVGCRVDYVFGEYELQSVGISQGEPAPWELRFVCDELFSLGVLSRNLMGYRLTEKGLERYVIEEVGGDTRHPGNAKAEDNVY